MIITTAMLAPFMVAAAPETPAQTQEPAAIYNWENQGSMNLIDEEEVKAGAMASFSCPPGQYSNQQVDDWHLA